MTAVFRSSILACSLVLGACGPAPEQSSSGRGLRAVLCLQFPATEASDVAVLDVFNALVEQFGGTVIDEYQATYFDNPSEEVHLHYYKTMQAYGRIMFAYGSGFGDHDLESQMRDIPGAYDCVNRIDSYISGG